MNWLEGSMESLSVSPTLTETLGLRLGGGKGMQAVIAKMVHYSQGSVRYSISVKRMDLLRESTSLFEMRRWEPSKYCSPFVLGVSDTVPISRY